MYHHYHAQLILVMPVAWMVRQSASHSTYALSSINIFPAGEAAAIQKTTTIN